MKLPESLNRARAAAFAAGEQQQGYTPGPYRPGYRPGAELPPAPQAPRPRPQGGRYADERRFRMEGARDRFLREGDVGAAGELAYELTGLPALAQAGRAFRAGDAQSGVTEGVTGALQLGGTLAPLPNRGLFGRRLPAAAPRSAEAPQPQSMPRPLGRARDGSVLPMRQPQPFRRTEARSEDLRGATAMRAPDAGGGGGEQVAARGRDAEIEKHMRGYCGDLACRISERTGYPLEAVQVQGVKEHFMVRLPNGNLLDARGELTPAQAIQGDWFSKGNARIVPATRDEVRAHHLREQGRDIETENLTQYDPIIDRLQAPHAPDGGAVSPGSAPSVGAEPAIAHRFDPKTRADIYEPSPGVEFAIMPGGRTAFAYNGRVRTGSGTGPEAQRVFRGAYQALLQDIATKGRSHYRWTPETPRQAELYRTAMRTRAPQGYAFSEGENGVMELNLSPQAPARGPSDTGNITSDPSGQMPQLDTTPSVTDPPAMRMERARRMGFDVDTPLYHGTDQPIDAFRTSDGWYGNGVYASRSPTQAEFYTRRTAAQAKGGQDNAPNIMPLVARGRFAPVDEYYALVNQNMPRGRWTKAGEANAVRKAQQELQERGYAGIDAGGPDQEVVIFEPRNLRSPFAAFDPARKGESDLLAGFGGLAALPAGAEAMRRRERQ